MKTRERAHRVGCVGLDLSLTGPAAAWIPKNWDGDTSVVKTATWPDPKFPKHATPNDIAARWDRISIAVCEFVRKCQPAAVFVEDYAYSAQSSSVTRLAEIGGIVRYELWRWSWQYLPTAITASTARKLMLERVPRKDAKDWTIANVRRLKGQALYWTGDQIDAIVIANAGARTLGWVPLSFPGIDL